ncbi:MAG: NUDIX domain-containing protein [Chlamydiales bacterium]|nr:NUDIX domain-containing protein [Chlamydiales bacterium]
MNQKAVHHDQSFGIVPLSQQSGSWEVFLIQHRHGRYWGFPKGHAEPGETPEQAASRELKEETNLDVIRYFEGKPMLEQYRFSLEGRRIFKQVLYFMAEVGGTVSLQEKEIQDGIWVPLLTAHETITHQEGKNIIAQVIKRLQL